MATVTLGAKNVGDIVKLNVNGTPRNFIVVHNGKPSALYDDSFNDGVILLMKDVYETRAWHSSNSNSYKASTIHSYLNSTFLNLFDADIKAQIIKVKIPYVSNYYSGTVSSGADGLEAQIFLPSAPEVRLTQNAYAVSGEGAPLSYFASGDRTNKADSKRVAYFNGAVADWWTRSPYTSASTSSWRVRTDGGLTNVLCSSAGGVRPALVLPSTLYVSDDGSVSTNTAPSTPDSIDVPYDISGGTTITISWAAATDAEGNLYGYKVEKSTDGGTSWAQIYQGPAISTTDAVAFGTDTVMYRVRAYDTEGLESGWRTSAQITVVNNRAPSAPVSITVPMTVNGGTSLVISWGAATDSDGNLSGYELERQVNGQSWEQIYRGDGLAFTDSIIKGWNTVAYRVRAYDDLDVAGTYTTSQTRTVNNNTAPVVTCDSPNGTDLGVKADGFTVDYSVDDVDADVVTVTEDIDNIKTRAFQAELGQSYTFEITGDTFMRVLNGKHTLTITAHDGQVGTVHKLTFTKEVTSASITLETPMEADAEITLAVLSVIGSIPADADYKVEVTNNGKDDLPVWQDVTAEVKSGVNIVFENHTADNGFAFNFRIAVERGESGQGGYIASVQGGFQ